MENFRVWKGKKAEIPNEKVNGRIYFTTDTQELFVDIDDERKGYCQSYLDGNSDPTDTTKGEIGQRYVNTSNGKWWVLQSISSGKYNWVEGAYTASKLTTPRSINGTPFDGTKDIDTKYSYNYKIYSANSEYISFVKIPFASKSNRRASILVTGGTTFGTNTMPCYYVTAKYYSSSPTVNVTCLSHVSENIKFGYYIDSNNYLCIAIKVQSYSETFFTVLARSANTIETEIVSHSETQPEGWTEIPVRKLLANGEVNAASDLTGILPVANGGTGNANGAAEYLNYHILTIDTDLNTITTPGLYRCGSKTTVATLTNCPTTHEFGLIVAESTGAMQLLFTYDTHEFYNRSSSASGWTNWTQYFNATNGGAVTGLIQNYGGIGIKFSSSSEQYIPFCKVRKSDTLQNSSATFIVSNAGNYGDIGGLWIISILSRLGNFYANIKCVNPARKDAVTFGYWYVDDYFYMGIGRKAYSNCFSITPLTTIGYNFQYPVIFYKGESTKSAPDGWTEIPQKVLQDEDQVAAAIRKSMPESSDVAVTHRNIFRGKNLGSSFTTAQKSAISSGTFDDLYVGDYWVIGGVTWRIVDIDYWWNCGDTACTTHHLVIMPDSNLYSAQMNETDITTGGYVGSKMYTTNLTNAKTTINTAFGSANILTHRDLLVNAVMDGHPSAGAWFNSTVELPNEIMMYGSCVYTPAGDGTMTSYRYTINKTQLALMRLHPKFIQSSRAWFWLRDVVSTINFAGVNAHCATTFNYASYSGGVRPVFGIIGA